MRSGVIGFGRALLGLTLLGLQLVACPQPEEEDPSPTSAVTPTITPVGDTPTPSLTPSGPTPTETPEVSTPTQTPGADTPTSTPGGDTPTETPGVVTPTQTPGGETPTETPAVPTPTGTVEPGDGDADGYTVLEGDCDDNDASVYPDATEVVDGKDNDCDTLIDEETGASDDDGDGYTELQGDCDDQDPGRSPGVSEIPYDGIDQNCSGADLTDQDGDGVLGGPGGADCDDLNPARAPGLSEIPYDGIDQDCSGTDLIDQDKDGAAGGTGGTDCDDLDPGRAPGIEEIPYDGIDQDCSGADLNDQDGDGYKGGSSGTDCDDTNANTFPGASEYADGKDNDCDGKIDEDLSTTDDDKDGYTEVQGDCNDASSSVYPGATEIAYDGIDQNCDGKDLSDLDADGYSGGSSGTDCDDDDPSIHPGATEIAYDGIDQDCSGSDLADLDKDGYTGTAAGGKDCDDSNAAINPGAKEVCDGKDNNCDKVVDTDATDRKTFYADSDGDGYGNAAVSTLSCQGSAGWVTNSLDCNDADANINPGAADICDEIDNNCNGKIDENGITTWYLDNDKDGYGSQNVSTQDCTQPDGFVSNNGDCNDFDITINPLATEVCDGKDNNCNSQTDEGVKTPWYLDSDKDGYGTSSITQQACTAPTGYVALSGDCNDSNAAINPKASELCNGVDDDCDGQVDESASANWYQDADKDTYGNPAVVQHTCAMPAGYVANNTDCDDTNALTHPGASEACDGEDNNCDGSVPEAETLGGAEGTCCTSVNECDSGLSCSAGFCTSLGGSCRSQQSSAGGTFVIDADGSGPAQPSSFYCPPYSADMAPVGLCQASVGAPPACRSWVGAGGYDFSKVDFSKTMTYKSVAVSRNGTLLPGNRGIIHLADTTLLSTSYTSTSAHRLSPTGVYSSFGSGMTKPLGMIQLFTGGVLVGDRDASARLFDGAGSFLQTFGGALGYFTQMPSGELWAGGYKGGVVKRFKADGTALTDLTHASFTNLPNVILTLADGTIVVSNYGTQYEGGSALGSLTFFNKDYTPRVFSSAPTGMTLNPDGSLSHANFSGQHELLQLPNGMILVASYKTNKIVRLKADGSYVDTLSLGGTCSGDSCSYSPSGMTLDATGRLLITTGTNVSRVVTFGP